MRKLLSAILFAIIASACMGQKYSVPVKIWAYGHDKAPTADDIKQTILNLNRLNAENKTGFQYYLLDYEFVDKKKFDNFGFYSQMPWQSITRHEKNILNIALVGRLKKGGHDNKDVNYSGVCFGPTGSVVVAMRDDPSVVTHEVGHFLGLKHQFDILDNIMSYNPKKSERRKFTDSQKQTMLAEAAKMKYSEKWKECASTLPDRYEPNDNLEMATVLKWNHAKGMTINAKVNSQGEFLDSDIDIVKYGISNKMEVLNPTIYIRSQTMNLIIEIMDSEERVIIQYNIEARRKGYEISIPKHKPGNYFIKVSSSNTKDKGEYSIALLNGSENYDDYVIEEDPTYW